MFSSKTYILDNCIRINDIVQDIVDGIVLDTLSGNFTLVGRRTIAGQLERPVVFGTIQNKFADIDDIFRLQIHTRLAIG